MATVTKTDLSPATRRHVEHRGHDPLNHPQEHVAGEMDIRAHEKTFDGFIRFLTWNVVGIVVILIFLALAGA